MSIRFAIRNTAEKAKREGEAVVRYSGTGEPFHHDDERQSRAIETDHNGIPTKWTFVTGLDETRVEFYSWLTDEEKKVVAETIAQLKPKIERHYGGEKMIQPENYSFWKKRRDINQLKLSHENIDVFYDTDNPPHALLYLSILAGAFGDVVAPNKDWAERHQIPHYLALEIETDVWGDDEDLTRSDAHAALAEIRKDHGKDALFILTWCLQYDMTAFGGVLYNVAERDLVNYSIKYIDGKLGIKGLKKKNYPKNFLEYVGKWKGAQTRPQLYTEAYVKAGEYFNFITQREKKFVTSEGTILGNTIAEAVTNLMKPKFKVDLDSLRTAVEAKWKE